MHPIRPVGRCWCRGPAWCPGRASHLVTRRPGYRRPRDGIGGGGHDGSHEPARSRKRGIHQYEERILARGHGTDHAFVSDLLEDERVEHRRGTIGLGAGGAIGAHLGERGDDRSAPVGADAEQSPRTHGGRIQEEIVGADLADDFQERNAASIDAQPFDGDGRLLLEHDPQHIPPQQHAGPGGSRLPTSSDGDRTEGPRALGIGGINISSQNLSDRHAGQGRTGPVENLTRDQSESGRNRRCQYDGNRERGQTHGEAFGF